MLHSRCAKSKDFATQTQVVVVSQLGVVTQNHGKCTYPLRMLNLCRYSIFISVSSFICETSCGGLLSGLCALVLITIGGRALMHECRSGFYKVFSIPKSFMRKMYAPQRKIICNSYEPTTYSWQFYLEEMIKFISIARLNVISAMQTMLC